MKIAAPVSSVREVEMLLHYGADELYCGLNTRGWDRAPGPRLWMNRRSPETANLPSEAELRTVVRMAHAAGAPVHVALNAPFYPEDRLDYVAGLSERLAGDAGVDGLIVSDVNLLIRLHALGLPAGLHLSSLGGCFNARAVGFFRGLGVKRVILPRQLTFSEIRRLVADSGPGTEFEVFALNDGCVFEEGLCQTTHTLGPFCMTDWTAAPFAPPGSGDGSRHPDLGEHAADLREYRWFQDNCGSSYQADGLPNGPCSLCGFSLFRDWGVAAVKIVGREASFYRKMRSLQMVKAVMEEVDRGAGLAETRSAARAIRSTPEYCRKGYMCYFRDETLLDPA
jgi:putative protease